MTKDPNRPRAIHKLNPQPGDVFRLVAWQDGDTIFVGREYTVDGCGTRMTHAGGGFFTIPSSSPKGSRALFICISRAAEQSAMVLYGNASPDRPWGDDLNYGDTHRMTIPLTASGELPDHATIKLEKLE